MNKNTKSILEILLFLVTLGMTVATFMAVRESALLRRLEAGPNISLSDIVLRVIDSTNTPVRRISWLHGDTLPNVTVKNIKTTYLTMQFKNTGKNAGYVRLIDDSMDNMMYKSVLVPADGQSGETYILDLEKDFGMNMYSSNSQNIVREFQFNSYDREGKFQKTDNLAIVCAKVFQNEYTVEISCAPVISD